MNKTATTTTQKKETINSAVFNFINLQNAICGTRIDLKLLVGFHPITNSFRKQNIV